MVQSNLQTLILCTYYTMKDNDLAMSKDIKTVLQGMQPEYFEPHNLILNFDGSGRIFKLALRALKKESASLFTELDEALEAGEALRIRELAHKFKGSALTFAADKLTQQLLLIMALADQGDLVNIDQLIKHARDNYYLLIAELDKLNDKLSEA